MENVIIGFWKNLDLARRHASKGKLRAAQTVLNGVPQLINWLDQGRAKKYSGELNDLCEVYNLESPICEDEITGRKTQPRFAQNLEQHVKQVKPGISLVTCSRNRTENLLQTLPGWLACPEISEIIIVDWTSDAPVLEALQQQGELDRRIKVLRVTDEPRWILSHAFNVGFRAASHERILKVDADIVLDRRFFKTNKLGQNAFISGDWRSAKEGQEFINGFFYIARSDLMKANGFSEFITSYGWDDDDLYDRLQRLGCHRQSVDPNFLHHLPHGDDVRVEGSGDLSLNAKQELTNNTEFKIQANRFLSNLMPVWNESRVMQPFSIWHESHGHFVLKRVGSPPCRVPDHIRKDAEHYAAAHVLSWKLSYDRVIDLKPEQLDNLLRARSLSEITKKDIDRQLDVDLTAPTIMTPRTKLFVDAQHGLGNRLRAIASAAVVANRDDRELVVVWQPDHHCDCRLGDLLNYQGAVVEQSFIETARRRNWTVYSYMEAEEQAEKDALIDLDPGRDAYVRTAYALNSPLTDWAAENAFLKRLDPSLEVIDLLHGVRRKNVLGVHVRMEGAPGTDYHSYDRPENWTAEGHKQLHHWRAASHYQHFTKRIDTLIKEKAVDNLYLAADTPQTYDIFAERYGDRLAYLKRDVFDRSKLQVQHGLADILILKDCEKLLGSSWSSFTELAVRLSDRFEKVEMSGTDF